jgi:hypothetical protein
MKDRVGDGWWRRQRGDFARAPRRLVGVIDQRDVDLGMSRKRKIG